MEIRIERDYEFEAAHWLPRVPEEHKCGRVHGHSYRLTLVLEGAIDEQTGWLMDFADVDAVARPLIARLDHATLNEIAGLENPTSENLAAWVWHAIAPSLPLLVEVRVSETRRSRAVYRGR